MRVTETSRICSGCVNCWCFCRFRQILNCLSPPEKSRLPSLGDSSLGSLVRFPRSPSEVPVPHTEQEDRCSLLASVRRVIKKGSGIQVMLAGKPQSAIRWINGAFLRHVLGGALPREHYPRISSARPWWAAGLPLTLEGEIIGGIGVGGGTEEQDIERAQAGLKNSGAGVRERQ